MAAPLATLIGTSLKSFAQNQGKKKVANAGRRMLSRKPPEEEQNKTQATPQTPETGPKTTYTPIKPSSSLVPIAKSSSSLVPIKKSSRSSGDIFTDIQLRVAEIEKIVSIDFKFKKSQEEKNRIKDEQKEFKDRENKLESGLNIRGFNFPFSIPGKGMFDQIMGSLIRFLMFITLGKLLPTIIKFLPTLQGILTTLAKIVGVIADMFGNILDGLIGFATWVDGIQARSKEIARSIGGDNLVGVIENFESAFNQFLNLALIAGMLSIGGDGLGSKKPGGKPSTKIRGPKSVSGRSGTGINPSTARRYAQKFGKNAAIKRFGQEGVKSLGGKYARSGVTNLARKGLVGTLGKSGTKAAINIVKPLVRNIPLIGGIIEFVLSWVSGDPVGRAAFKGVGAGLGTWIGGALGTLMGPGIGTAIGMFLGGMGGSALGGMLYDGIFSGKKIPKPKNNIETKNKGGRITRSGKSVGGKIRRSVPKQNTIRKPSSLKIPLQPGKDAGGLQKIKQLYDAEKKSGSSGFSAALNPGSPYVVLEKLSGIFKNIPFIGNWMGSAIDVALGQRPPEKLYQNYADSLGYFISNIVQSRVSSATSKVFGLLSTLESGGTVTSTRTSIRDIQNELNTKDISETISMLVRNDMNKALQVVRDAANIKIAKAGTPGGDYLPGDGGFGEGGGGSSGTSSFMKGTIPDSVKNDREFTEGVKKLAEKYDIPEDFLYAVMGFETGGTFNPAERNKAGSGATGLIQFMPETARGLGTSTSQLAKMSRVEQLKYVDKYFSSKNIKGGSLSDIYMAVLLPAAVGKPDDFVLFGNGGAYGGSRAYRQNKGLDLNNDGKITKWEATQKVRDYLPQSESAYYDNKNKTTSANSITEGGIKPSSSFITSRFGMREDPVYGGWRMHNGVDYALPIGTPISIIKPGVVIDASIGYNVGYGNLVIIQHKDGTYSQYNHMSEVQVKKGDSVGGGKVIGTVGTTGKSTGPHLDFMIGSSTYNTPNGLGLGGIRNPEPYADSTFRFGGDVKVKPSVVKEYPAILNGQEGVYVTDANGKRTWKAKKWTKEQRELAGSNNQNNKVIRSFKVGNDTYTEREGGVYTKNGRPISKDAFNSRVASTQITPEQAGSYADRLRNMKPGSGESLRIPGVGTVVQGRNIFGRPEEKYFNSDGTPAKKDEFFNRVRNKLPNTSRMQGGGIISPKQPNNPNVSRFAPHEDPFVNNKQIVFVPIPIPQKVPAGTSQASMPVTAMKFVPTTKDSSNIDQHFRV